MQTAAPRWPQRPPHVTPMTWETRRTADEYRRQYRRDQTAEALAWFAVDRDLREQWDTASPQAVARVLADATRTAHRAGVVDPREVLPLPGSQVCRVDAATAAHLLHIARVDARSLITTAREWAAALEDHPERTLWLAGLLYMSAGSRSPR